MYNLISQLEKLNIQHIERCDEKMKEITMFILEGCPYCRQALSWMEELKKENPAYASIPVKIIDEKKEADLANQFDYYYVPTYYVDEEKLHEGVAKKEIIQNIFEKALEK